MVSNIAEIIAFSIVMYHLPKRERSEYVRMAGQGKEWFCLLYLIGECFKLPSLIWRLWVVGANKGQFHDFDDYVIMIFLDSWYELIWFTCTLWFLFVYYECVTAIPHFYNFAYQDGLSDWRYRHETINIFAAVIANVASFVLMYLEIQHVFHQQWFV